MTTPYEPGPAAGAEIEKQADVWTLVLTRELRHAPAKVWTALTDPDQLREWAPFDADRSLGTAGPVMLTTIEAPSPAVSETRVTRAEAPKLLEYAWGGANVRWELEALGSGGTRLKLWHSIPRGYISMGAAGWHICFDVLERLLEGRPLGRIVGAKAMRFGWQRLLAEYSAMLGVEAPKWPPQMKA